MYGNFVEHLSELAIAFELVLNSTDNRIMTELIIKKIIPNKTKEIYLSEREIEEMNHINSGYRKNEVIYS